MSFAILVGLTIGAFIRSTVALPSGLDISIRQAVQATPDPNGLPANWTLLGCFTDDNPATRTLQEASFVNPSMTPLLCAQFCSETHGTPSQYNFAGTEYTQECYCDFNIQGGAQQIDNSECNFLCGGDGNQTCGGASKISVYKNLNAGLLATPSNKAIVVGGWSFLGCFSDALNGKPRTLDVRLDIPEGVTIESCTAHCGSAGFATAGLEFAQECWCGNSFDQTTRGNLSSCSQTCKADHTELCGAANFLSIYTLGVPVVSSASVTTASSTAKPTSTVVPTSLPPVTSPTTTAPHTTTTASTTVASPTTTSTRGIGTTVTATAPTVTVTIPTIIPTVTGVPTIIPTTTLKL